MDPSGSRGRFIALEGPDGGGKTTQAARLATWLGAEGREVVACRDPGGTALGEQLRTLVKERSSTAIGMRAEMLLYMASRAQLVDDVIRPALARGAFVVSDRFVLSNVAYQGYAGGLDVAEVWAVARAATGALMPDLTLVVDVEPAVARDRIGPGRDRIEDRGPGYMARVRSGFLEAVAGYPGPIAVVDGAGEADAVESRIRDEVKRALAIDPRS